MQKSMKYADTQTILHTVPKSFSMPTEQHSLLLLSQAVSDNQILVVTDNSELRQLIAEILQETGYTVLVAGNDKTALSILATQAVDLVLLDATSSDLDAVATLLTIRQQSPIPVIIFPIEYHAMFYMPHPALESKAYLPKPFFLQPLVEAVQLVLLGAQFGTLSK
jgi:DNA-binding response OmpR family regulator